MKVKTALYLLLALFAMALSACQHGKSRLIDGDSIDCDQQANAERPECVAHAL